MQTTSLFSADQKLEVSSLCLGVMNFGSIVDEDTSFAIMDRFFEAGGTFFDTANNYNAWVPGFGGLESETVLGRWIASRKVASDVVVATKVGAAKIDPSRPLSGRPPTNYEGLAPETVRTQLTGSLTRLGLDRVGVYYGHVDDRTRDITETADLFAALAEEGLITIPGISNTATWRLAIARRHSQNAGRPEFGAWQQQGTALWPRPGFAEDAVVTPEAIDYSASEPELTILTWATQQGGLFSRPWMPLREVYDHPGSLERIRAVQGIAHDLGATANQVIMAWMVGGPASTVVNVAGGSTASLEDLPSRQSRMLPIFGASSVAQLDEALGGLHLELSDEHRSILDAP